MSDFFFFMHKSAYEMLISDWSSDVCSSDLLNIHLRILLPHIWNDARHGARRGIRANGCRYCARTDHNNSASQKERTGFRLHERISPYPFELASRNHSSTDRTSVV